MILEKAELLTHEQSPNWCDKFYLFTIPIVNNIPIISKYVDSVVDGVPDNNQLYFYVNEHTNKFGMYINFLILIITTINQNKQHVCGGRELYKLGRRATKYESQRDDNNNKRDV